MSETGTVQALKGNTFMGKETQTLEKRNAGDFVWATNKPKTTEMISEKKKKRKKKKRNQSRTKRKEEKAKEMMKNGWEVQSLKGYRFRLKFKHNFLPHLFTPPTSIHHPLI